jgi:hypothetical protein
MNKIGTGNRKDLTLLRLTDLQTILLFCSSGLITAFDFLISKMIPQRQIYFSGIPIVPIKIILIAVLG